MIFLKDVEGQLFADLALTIAIAVILSLVVAVTVLPVATCRWLTGSGLKDAHAGVWSRLASALIQATDTPARRGVWIVGLMVVPVVVTVLLLPRLDYLPPVKRDAIDGMLMTPPGSNVETIDEEIAQTLIRRLEPYMKGEAEPALRNYYLFVWPGRGMVGARARDQPCLTAVDSVNSTYEQPHDLYRHRRRQPALVEDADGNLRPPDPERRTQHDPGQAAEVFRRGVTRGQHLLSQDQ